MQRLSSNILIILSGASHLQLKSGKKVKTGFFLSELAVPLLKLKERGCRVSFANTTGATPCMDPLSDSSFWFGFRTGEYHQCKELIDTEFQNPSEGSLKTPFKFSDISEEQLRRFDAVFVPGGHAPLMDLGNNLDLGRILCHFHDNSKPTVVICHGSVALLSTNTFRPNNFPYKNYHVTCYSDLEEGMNELMWFDKVPLKVESSLRVAGCEVSNRLPMFPHVVIEGELISGQGPTSVWKFADTFVNILELSRPIFTQPQPQPQPQAH